MYKTVVPVVALCACCASLCFANGTGAKPVPVPLTNAADAVSRAIAYTGFDQCPSFVPKPPQDVAHLSDTSQYVRLLLGDTLRDVAIWTVTFDSIIINVPYYPDSIEQKHPRDFKVLLNAENGELLQVSFRFTGGFEWGETDPWASVPSEVHVPHRTAQFAATSRIPRNTLYDVMQLDCTRKTLEANEFVAYYGSAYQHNRELSSQWWLSESPEPVWLLIAKCFDPFTPDTSASRPERGMPFEVSCIVNAESGKESPILKVASHNIDWWKH
jgi:hypothetical protein